MSDSDTDPNIHDSFTKFKSDGPYVFWRTLEIMSREFDIKTPAENVFSVSFLTSMYRLRRDRVLLILDFFSTCGRLPVELFENGGTKMIRIKCPKLKDLTDEYTKKLLSKESGHSPSQEVEVEEEPYNKEHPVYIEQEKEKIKETDQRVVTNNKEQKIKEDTKQVNVYVEEIVNYLNEKLGTGYKSTAGKTRDLIKARLKEGFVVANFKTVIDKKYQEWGDDSEMSKYLRPVTLFNNKFEGYLQQIFVREKSNLERSIERQMRKYGGNKNDS